MQEGTTFKPEDSLAVLLVGAPMSGKTNVAMGFKNPWFASTDKKLGNAVARHPGKTFYYDHFDVDSNGVPIPEEKKWPALTAAVEAAGKDPRVGTIVLDNLTDISSYLVAFILSLGGSKLTVGGQKVMEKSHWGPFKGLLTRLIYTARSYNKYVVACCHELVESDEVTGVLTYRPMVPGSLRDCIGGLFTDTWRCEVVVANSVAKYVVRTAPTVRQMLGTSLGLPPTFEFSWQELEKYLNKGA